MRAIPTRRLDQATFGRIEVPATTLAPDSRVFCIDCATDQHRAAGTNPANGTCRIPDDQLVRKHVSGHYGAHTHHGEFTQCDAWTDRGVGAYRHTPLNLRPERLGGRLGGLETGELGIACSRETVIGEDDVR